MLVCGEAYDDSELGGGWRLTVWVARATVEERFLDCARNDMLAVVAAWWGCGVWGDLRGEYEKER